MIPNFFEYPFLIRIFDKLLSDQDKINIISVSKFLNKNKTKFKFYNKYICKYEDSNEWYFESLTNIIVDKIFEFPKSITKLTFDYFFNDYVRNIPNTVTHLKFGDHFNQILNEGDIPYSVTHLKFGLYFNQKINDAIPKNVKYLKFGSYFNRSIHDLPHSITHLALGRFFNKNVKYFPKSIIYLEFEYGFDRKIDLPMSLKKLKGSHLFLWNNENDLLLIRPKIKYND